MMLSLSAALVATGSFRIKSHIEGIERLRLNIDAVHVYASFRIKSHIEGIERIRCFVDIWRRKRVSEANPILRGLKDRFYLELWCFFYLFQKLIPY